MDQGSLRLLSRGVAPAVTSDAHPGGAGPSNTSLTACVLSAGAEVVERDVHSHHQVVPCSWPHGGPITLASDTRTSTRVNRISCRPRRTTSRTPNGEVGGQRPRRCSRIPDSPSGGVLGDGSLSGTRHERHRGLPELERRHRLEDDAYAQVRRRTVEFAGTSTEHRSFDQLCRRVGARPGGAGVVRRKTGV